jgi:N-acetylglucosaminyldiphosphoundecaprenol N-acetyl-beta-D-mannosaminyltransferase
MSFMTLPFLKVSDFNYAEIARRIEAEDPDLVFVSLGMPKQEFFMHRLCPFLARGILIGVGAAFKFHSGLPDQKRAPQWMIRFKLEWLYRIFSEPNKQIKRCILIITSLPFLLVREYREKKDKKHDI